MVHGKLIEDVLAKLQAKRPDGVPPKWTAEETYRSAAVEALYALTELGYSVVPAPLAQPEPPPPPTAEQRAMWERTACARNPWADGTVWVGNAQPAVPISPMGTIRYTGQSLHTTGCNRNP